MNNRQKPSRSFNTVKHSNREGRIKRYERGRMLLLAIFAIAAAIFLTLFVFLIASIANAVGNRLPAKDPTNNSVTTTDRGDADQDPPADAVVYVQGSQDNQNIYIGPLIEVNADHEYTAFDREENKLINMYQNISKDEDGSNNCQFLDGHLLMHKTAFSAFDELAKAYVKAEGSRDLLVATAYRTYEEQAGKQFPQGHSDYHTGYLLELKRAVFEGSTPTAPLDEDGWLYSNAHKYGFVSRYPDGKESITGISDYTYAFRYVGVAHATYMYKYDYCLEEYLDLLRNNHSGSANSLKITDDSGNAYEVYYAPANSGDITLLELPSNYHYEISGDNTSGFVVTVLLNSPKA